MVRKSIRVGAESFSLKALSRSTWTQLRLSLDMLGGISSMSKLRPETRAVNTTKMHVTNRMLLNYPWLFSLGSSTVVGRMMARRWPC